MSERTSLTPDFQIGEAALSSILAVSVDAIVAVDDAQRIIFYNRGAEDVFGWTVDEVLGQRLEMLIPHAKRPNHEQQVQAFGRGPVEARRMGERGSITGLRKNGEVFPAEASITRVLSNGRPVYTAVLRDVSARVRAERERAELLRRAEEARAAAERAERRTAQIAEASEIFSSTLDFHATLENLAHFMVPWFADGCLLDVVAGPSEFRRLEAIHRTRHAEAQRLLEFGPTEGSLAISAHTIRTGEPVLVPVVADETLRPFTRSEEHYEALMALRPVSFLVVPLAARGTIMGALTCLRTDGATPYDASDVTLAAEVARRAALAADNARLYHQAQHATRARDDILGVVSHDLRNPLSAIAMCSGALLESPADASSTQYLLETIQRSADWMKTLIQDLLDVASLDSGKLRIERGAMDVRATLDEACELFEQGAQERQVSLSVEVPEPVPDVQADRGRILQVLSNLVGNALKFTPAGGRITLRAWRREGMVHVTVSDTGSGIPQEELPHIFDRHWHKQRNARERGTGLGLAIASGLVEAHGGRIWAESEPGKGSDFHLTLPIA